jgi:hypothetical protein
MRGGPALGAGEAEGGHEMPDGRALQQRGLTRLKARFMRRNKDAGVDIPPSSFDYAGSMGFPQVWPHLFAMDESLHKCASFSFPLLTQQKTIAEARKVMCHRRELVLFDMHLCLREL